jgi:hypothetical protein
MTPWVSTSPPISAYHLQEKLLVIVIQEKFPVMEAGNDMEHIESAVVKSKWTLDGYQWQ